MGTVYIVAAFKNDSDGRSYSVMRDMDGNGAFESLDEAAKLVEAAEKSGVFVGEYFRIIGLGVKEAQSWA